MGGDGWKERVELPRVVGFLCGKRAVEQVGRVAGKF